MRGTIDIVSDPEESSDVQEDENTDDGEDVNEIDQDAFSAAIRFEINDAIKQAFRKEREDREKEKAKSTKWNKETFLLGLQDIQTREAFYRKVGYPENASPKAILAVNMGAVAVVLFGVWCLSRIHAN